MESLGVLIRTWGCLRQQCLVSLADSTKMSSTADDAVDIAKQEVDYRVELFNKYALLNDFYN